MIKQSEFNARITSRNLDFAAAGFLDALAGWCSMEGSNGVILACKVEQIVGGTALAEELIAAGELVAVGDAVGIHAYRITQDWEKEAVQSAPAVVQDEVVLDVTVDGPSPLVLDIIDEMTDEEADLIDDVEDAFAPVFDINTGELMDDTEEQIEGTDVLRPISELLSDDDADDEGDDEFTVAELEAGFKKFRDIYTRRVRNSDYMWDVWCETVDRLLSIQDVLDYAQAHVDTYGESVSPADQWLEKLEP